MITITTLTNSFILNGSQYQKGSLVVMPSPDGVKIGAFYDTFTNIEVDGETYASAQLLHEALDTKLFKAGGGSGEGLQWSDASYAPEGSKLARYSPQGMLNTNQAEFPENAVPLYQVEFLIEQGMLSKATVADMQNGTDDVKYVSPYLVQLFVEWFSNELLIYNEDITEPITSAQANTLYPDARVRTLLYLPNVGSGLKYTKISNTEWESQPYTVA